VRTILPRCWFDRVRCRQGVEYLREYRAQYDEKRQVLSNRPLHDRASHAADAFRVLATAHRSVVARSSQRRQRELAWIV
jgi:phage terminase large subunit